MTSLVVPPERLPARLTAVGWKHELHVRGALAADGPAVAIVGARAATVVAMRRAHAIARHLADRGVHVVSGGALGIDGAAHRGAIAGGGTTTVVLGSGLDVIYPDRHARLFQQILLGGGALVSLLDDGMKPRRGTFLGRNPLIAALADVLVVVEADLRSGSLSTANAARTLGRVVVAWPGSRGCDRLIASGAAIVEQVEDVDLALAGTPRYPAPVVLDPEIKLVRDSIAAGIRGVDAIVAHTGLPVPHVLRALARLP